MSKRDVSVLIDDVRSAIEKIARYTTGLDRERFLADEKTIDAVVRNLEIIGEAVKVLPPEFKAAHPEIAWTQIAGLRNRIVHDYAGIDTEIIWQVLQSASRATSATAVAGIMPGQGEGLLATSPISTAHAYTRDLVTMTFGLTTSCPSGRVGLYL